MKRPNNWPAAWRIKKTANTDRFGSGGEYAVYEGENQIATVYRSSRGWAWTGKYGAAGQGYAGIPTLHDCLHDLAFVVALDEPH